MAWWQRRQPVAELVLEEDTRAELERVYGADIVARVQAASAGVSHLRCDGVPPFRWIATRPTGSFVVDELGVVSARSLRGFRVFIAQGATCGESVEVVVQRAASYADIAIRYHPREAGAEPPHFEEHRYVFCSLLREPDADELVRIGVDGQTWAVDTAVIARHARQRRQE